MPADDRVLRAAVYLRQSLDRDGGELAVTRQREDCLRIVDERGWSLTETYVDNSISASKRTVRRPAYDRMVVDYAAGRFTALVCWDLDRLTRQPRQLEDWIDAAEEHGLRLVTANGEADLATDGGRLFARIKAGVARAEIERKSARQRRAALQSAQKGTRIGGRRPFGYDDDGMTVRAEEKAAIVRAYRDVLDGVPLGQVARDWNAAELRSGQRSYRRETRGQPVAWGHDTVRKVLLNPRNIGVRTHLGEEIGPAQWPALIDVESFRAVAALLSDPTRHRGGAGHAGKQLLTGLATCALCGAKVHGGGATHGKPVYRCAEAAHMSRLRDPVDGYVATVILNRLHRDRHQLVIVRDDRDEANELRAEAAHIRQEMHRLAVETASGQSIWDAAQARTLNIGWRERLARVDARQAEIGQVSALAVFADETKTVLDIWRRLDVARRRAAVGALADVALSPVGRGTRTFRPETVTVTWLTPPV